MNNFIINNLENIYSDFKSHLSKLNNYCHLRDLRFNYNTPNYDNLSIQQLYLLRYFPAFFLEYYEIYNKLLARDFIEFPFNILSIGTGCGIDYFALEYALRTKQNSCSTHVIYTGIDKIDWQYKNYLNNNHCKFIQIDVNELHSLGYNDYNIIFFPKSISEFESAAFGNILKLFQDTNFCEDKIALICSFRKENIDHQNDRFNRIIEIFRKNHNYDNDNYIDIFRYNKRTALRTIFGFSYPKEIIDYIRILGNSCKDYNASCLDCSEIIGRHPIVTTDFIIYSINLMLNKGGGEV